MGLIRRRYRNLGFFRPELSLKDRVRRLFDVDASGTYAPYGLAAHRKQAMRLWAETTAVAGDLEVVFGNRYGFPLNVMVTLTAEWEDGRMERIHSDYPCPTPAPASELVLYLPARPASLRIDTSSWSGALGVNGFRLFKPGNEIPSKAVTDADHVEQVEAWPRNPNPGFTLLPRASKAGIRIVY